jgi:ankyrin repeat protein
MKKIALYILLTICQISTSIEQKIPAEQQDINNKLFKSGAQATSKPIGWNGHSALAQAIMLANVEIAQLLLDKGAKANDAVAVLQAIDNNYQQIVKILLKAGVPVRELHKNLGPKNNQKDSINLPKEPRETKAQQAVNRTYYTKQITPLELYSNINNY